MQGLLLLFIKAQMIIYDVCKWGIYLNEDMNSEGTIVPENYSITHWKALLFELKANQYSGHQIGRTLKMVLEIKIKVARCQIIMRPKIWILHDFYFELRFKDLWRLQYQIIGFHKYFPASLSRRITIFISSYNTINCHIIIYLLLFFPTSPKNKGWKSVCKFFTI